MDAPFTLIIVAQSGRLQYEALLFAHALRRVAPDLMPALHIAEPQPGPLWPDDPRISPAIKDDLQALGATIIPFESRHFGASYPYGNKIECLTAMPAGRPFLFFDTDTLLLQDPRSLPIDFARPAASLRREGTWPKPHDGWPGYQTIWSSLYQHCGLTITGTHDPAFPPDHWAHYLYFNAGWFFGADPHLFGQRFCNMALAIRDAPPAPLKGQKLDPWLDQVTLPLVIHSLGGGRPDATLAGLDGAVSCHWRNLPLLYARESDAVVALIEDLAHSPKIKKHLREWLPAKRMIYQQKGTKARALFDRASLPPHEQAIRKTLKAEGLWIT